MFGKNLILNEQTLNTIEEIGHHMPGGFFIYKAAGNEELIYANVATIRMFGCDTLDEFKSLTGYTFRGMLHPDDYEQVVGSVNDQIRTNDDKNDHVEYRIIRKDGSIRWIDDYGHYTETENYGGIYYVFISDITDRHEQKDKMITALASDYRSVYHVDLDENDAVCYRADPDDHEQHPEGVHFPYLEYFTRYAENSVDEKYRDDFLNFINPDTIRDKLSNNNIIAYRYLVRRNEKEYYEMIRMAGVRHARDREDHIVHAIGLGLTDIDTDMREAMNKNNALSEALTAAEEANKAKTAFLSNMSHEIRTPMNAIIGLDNLALGKNNLDDETRNYLEKIGVNAKHLLELINDILDMSRIESGRMILKNEKFSFSDMLVQINDMVLAQCKDKGLTYNYKVFGNFSDHYTGDVTKLKQVLVNILSNAIKFTDAPGEVNLLVERTNVYENKSTLRFVITDTGIGMSEEFIPKLFDTFTQENSNRNNKYGSTGLGMAIAKNIVELMNGTIKVESKKNVGTRFTVTVTLTNYIGDSRDTNSTDPTKITNSVKISVTAEKKRASLKGRHILLAEDVLINAEIIKELLKTKESIIDHAENGRIALDMFKQSKPYYYDAVLMDIRMPEMDGLEACENIRALDRPDAKTVPIIAMTANAFDEDVQHSLQVGMNAHLSKPVDIDILSKTLEELIWEACQG